MLRILISAGLMAGVQVVSADNSEVFEPAFAADQKQITLEVIQAEASQFKSLKEWREALERKEELFEKAKLSQRQYERAVKLDKNGTITKEKLALAQYQYEHERDQSLASEASVVEARARLERWKLMVMAKGDSSLDLAPQIISQEIAEHKSTVAALNAMKSSTALAARLTEAKLDSGRKLYEQAIISEAEFDMRRLNANLAQREIGDLTQKIEDEKVIIRGLEATAKRLREQQRVNSARSSVQ